MAIGSETADGGPATHEPDRRRQPWAPASLRPKLPRTVTAVLAALAAAALAALFLAALPGASPARAAAVVVIGLGACGAAFAAGRAGSGVAGRLDLLRRSPDAARGARVIAAADGRTIDANLAFKRLFLVGRLFPVGSARPRDAIEQSAAADPTRSAELRPVGEDAAAQPRAAAAPVPASNGGAAAGDFDGSASPFGEPRGISLCTPRDSAPEPGAAMVGASGAEPPPGAQAPSPGAPVPRFFANAPVGIAVVDQRGRFVEANQALGELFGAAPQELVGRELIGWLNHGDRAAIAAKLGAAADDRAGREPVEVRLEGGRERTMVLLFSRLDDHALAAASALTAGMPDCAAARARGDDDPDGRLTLYFIDVTEQKSLETQFAQSQKMQAVGQLAGGVAHDFNNLLTAMIGFCDLLLLRSRPGDPAFADIMQIKQNANRAANLVRQLLAFSRQQSLQPRVLDITDVLVELSHLLRRLIGEDIALEVEHGRDLGLVKVDQGQLEQVVINLAVNARDAMAAGGRLTIRTANLHQPSPSRRGLEVVPAGDYVLIEVADTGVGIAPANLARIFEPFFSTKEVGSGTGLGLSTVYGIVKQTGGFVFVESTPGRGTAFEIYLPRHQAALDAPATRASAVEPAAAKDLTGTAAVMLVEDDDAVRMFGGAGPAQQGLPRHRGQERRGGARAVQRRNGKVRSVDHRCGDAADGRAGADPRGAPGRSRHQGHLYFRVYRGHVPPAARQRQRHSFSLQAVQLEAARR